jgi:hypothetical protein
MKKKLWRFSFLDKTEYQPHPILGTINPYEVVVIKAETYDLARQAMFDIVGKEWGFQYDFDESEKDYYSYVFTAEVMKREDNEGYYYDTYPLTYFGSKTSFKMIDRTNVISNALSTSYYGKANNEED